MGDYPDRAQTERITWASFGKRFFWTATSESQAHRSGTLSSTSLFIHMYTYICIQSPTELWKKNVSIYRRRLSMIEKLRTFFFSIIIVSIFFFHNSVGDCMSIDSQFECILRGNIEL